MSTPEQPTLLAPPIPSFGGYAPQQGELQGVTFWPRAGARIIDTIVQYIVGSISAFLFGIMLLIASGGHASPAVLAKLDHTGVPGFILALLGGLAYHVVFSSVHGSTIGKIVFSMVVVQEDGSPCKFRSALIRELGYFVDALFFGLIAYSAMKDDIRQQRHGDSWAHTVVCKRALIPPEKRRGADRFVIALIFAFIAEAAFMMISLLIAIAG